MENINVLMLGPLDVHGGMSTVMKNYINSNIFKQNINLMYISTSTDGSIILKLLKSSIALIKLVFILVFNSIDIVHVHVALDGSIYRKGIFMRLSKLFNKSIVLHFHASDLEEFYYKRCDKNKKKIVLGIFNMADHVISLNKSMKEKLNDILGVNSTVLYNFTNNIDKPIYNLNSKNILMISRITYDKGIYELINVMDNLKKNNIKLILAGDSDEIDDIKLYVKSRKLEENIVFLGWVDEKQKYELFKDCFVSILPSHFEGIPMSILESLSYGVPVIASNIGGIPEIISQGKEGFLHEVYDEQELERLILYLYKNKDVKQMLSNNCIDRFRSKFCVEKHINFLNNIYNETIKSKI